jgi:hypothetical protein
MVNHLFIVYNYLIIIIFILGIDTCMLTKKLCEHGTMLGKVKSSYFFTFFTTSVMNRLLWKELIQNQFHFKIKIKLILWYKFQFRYVNSVIFFGCLFFVELLGTTCI